MEYIIAGIAIFLITVSIIELLSYAYRNSQTAKRNRIRKRFRKYVFIESDETGTDIVKKRVLSDVPLLNSLLSRTPFFLRFDQMIAQANAKSRAGFYIMAMLFLGAVGFTAAHIFTRNVIISMVFGLMLAPIPILLLLNMKKKRIERFKKQLPDGLDLIARARIRGDSQ
jgi:tight adherence protein B